MRLVVAFVYAIFIWVLCAFHLAQAEPITADWQTDSWFSLLESLSGPTVLEGAHAHGSWGTKIGFGGSQYRLSKEVPHSALIYNDKTQNKETLFVPRVYLTKGTPIGIDFGLQYATGENRMFTLAGGYMQWSFYQELAMPALAIRTSFTELQGIESTRFQAVHPELLTSYGFLRYFEIYGGVGGLYSQAAYDDSQDQQLTLLPDSLAPPPAASATRIRASGRAGLQITLGSPFFSATAEYFTQGDNPVWSGKLAIGI